jgi:hypothetical protein
MHPVDLLAFEYLLGSFGAAQITHKWKKQHKNVFSSCFGQILLEERA